MTGEVVGGMRCDDDGCFRTELQRKVDQSQKSHAMYDLLHYGVF